MDIIHLVWNYFNYLNVRNFAQDFVIMKIKTGSVEWTVLFRTGSVLKGTITEILDFDNPHNKIWNILLPTTVWDVCDDAIDLFIIILP